MTFYVNLDGRCPAGTMGVPTLTSSRRLDGRRRFRPTAATRPVIRGNEPLPLIVQRARASPSIKMGLQGNQTGLHVNRLNVDWCC
jgi:hypothetical protein